jgi:hypothetical protein
MLSERIASVFMITSSVSAKLSEFCYPELKAIESISCKIGPDATASQAGAAIVARLQPATAVRVGTGLRNSGDCCSRCCFIAARQHGATRQGGARTLTPGSKQSGPRNNKPQQPSVLTSARSCLGSKCQRWSRGSLQADSSPKHGRDFDLVPPTPWLDTGYALSQGRNEGRFGYR